MKQQGWQEIRSGGSSGSKPWGRNGLIHKERVDDVERWEYFGSRQIKHEFGKKEGAEHSLKDSDLRDGLLWAGPKQTWAVKSRSVSHVWDTGQMSV